MIELSPSAHLPVDLLQPIAHRIDDTAMTEPLHLPVRVVLARTSEQLRKAVALRASAYARHLPEAQDLLAEPERFDLSEDSLVFLAESKEDGAAVGTLRVQTNTRKPLGIQESVAIPEKYSTRPCVGVTRLAVKDGRSGRNVKLILFKALYRYCFATQIDSILIAARPPLDKEYRKIGFKDILGERALFPIRTAMNIPHFILGFDVLTAERTWHECNHRLYNFMAREYHPDIEVFASLSGMWSRPRKQARPLPVTAPGTPFQFPLV
jgi:hypothetical protein